METKNNDVVEIDLKELFLVLLHKFWIIAIIGILFAVIAGLVSIYMIEPIYTSSTKVYVINRQNYNTITLSDLQSGTQITKDYMILVKSRPVTEQVIENLNLNLTHEELAKLITVSVPEDTRVLEISVSCTDAALAKNLVDAIASVSSQRMESVMEIKNVNVMEPGNLPIYPSSPDKKKIIMLGGFSGVAITSIIIMLAYLMNDSIKTTEDVEKYLGLTTLSSIPLNEVYKKKNKKKNIKIRQSENSSDLAS